MNPNDCIVPLFGLDMNGKSQKFLGTTAFVDETNLLLTAKHVVDAWDGPKYGFSLMGDLVVGHEAELVAVDNGRDLALLKAKDFSAERALGLLDRNQGINPNKTIVSYEYGMTYTAGNMVHVSPATRLGNVTRIVDRTDHYGAAGRQMLELSFPALRGASGAPVLSNEGFKLLGMIIANVSLHLLPAQIETIYDESGKIEENTQFMLPQALAVNVAEIRTFLEASY